MDARVASVCELPSAQRQGAMKTVVDEACGGTPAEIRSLILALVSDAVPPSVANSALSRLGEHLKTVSERHTATWVRLTNEWEVLGAQPDSAAKTAAVEVAERAFEEWKAAVAPHIQLLQFAVDTIAPRVGSFPEFDATVRRLLSRCLEEREDEDDIVNAARLLGGITATLSDDEHAFDYVKVADLYMRADKTADASLFVKKANEVISSTTDPAVRLQWMHCRAQVQDSGCKFYVAALMYHQLSSSDSDAISEHKLQEFLEDALRCVCLAPAGPRTLRLMDTIHRDPRAAKTVGYFLLDRMYRQQIVRGPEAAEFKALLKPHQKAELPDGMTVYDRAIIQHNLLAASRIYTSVAIDEIARMLSIQPTVAERLASTMIAENRLEAKIDQIAGLLSFNQDGQSALNTWDVTLKQICTSVSKACDEVEAKYPAVYATAVDGQ